MLSALLPLLTAIAAAQQQHQQRAEHVMLCSRRLPFIVVWPSVTGLAVARAGRTPLSYHQAVLLPFCCATCRALLPPYFPVLPGAVYSNKSNWADFAPMGFNGIFRGASVVFFAYLVRPLPAKITTLWALQVWRGVLCKPGELQLQNMHN